MDDYFHQSNLIEGYDDPEFDAQSVIAWDFLCKQKKLTDSIIKKVQKIITLKQTDLRPDWRGYYRDLSGQDVYIAGRKGMDPGKIPVAMKNWLSVIDFTHPHAAHVEFEKIHPFVDGNGRTGRMLMWWQQKQRGEELTYISYAERLSYYQWFR